MAGDSDYAQRQFRADKAARARDGEIEQELRALRTKVRSLEQQVASLTTELSRRKVIGEARGGYS